VKRSIAVAVVVLAIVTIYAPAVQNGLVWDDTALILRDPLIRSWRLIGEGFNHFLFTDATASDFYRPLQRLTYTLEYAAFVFRPGPYHLTNILLHAAAGVALLFFAEELLQAFGIECRRRRWIATIATLIWAIHPVQSGAVIYISGRADPLAASFGFLGCYLTLRSLRAQPGRELLWLTGAGVSFLLSALSKEVGLIFPVVAIVLLLFMKKRSAALKTSIGAAFICAIYLSLRLPAEHNPPPALQSPPPLTMRPIAMARAFAEYAGLLALPVNLHMDRQIDAFLNGFDNVNINGPAWRELQTLFGIVLIAVAAYFTIRVRTRHPLVFTLLILAGLTYLPISGAVTWNASVAEHWLYLPSAFLSLAATVALAAAWQSESMRRYAFRAMAGAIACWLAFLSGRTFVRCFDWKDQRTFLERTIADGGDSARMRINLGGLELSEGNLEVAKKDLTAALHKEPGQPLAIINLATVAVKQNDYQTAQDLLIRATQMPLVAARAHELLAISDAKNGRPVNPLRLRLAARTGPPNWSIEKRYIKFVDESGATQAAVKELQFCLQTEWYRAESWELLSALLTKMGRKNEADIAMIRAVAYDVHLTEHANFL
jgi:tetratricopeptide (TPR) repeat protein